MDRILYDSELSPVGLASRRHTQAMITDLKKRAQWMRENFEQYAKDNPDSEFVKNMKSNRGLGDTCLYITERPYSKPLP